MWRRFSLAALVLGCLSCACFGAGPGRTAAAPGTCTVNLHNGRWDRVTLEARIGDDPDPEANRSLGSRSLGRGETWTIESKGEDVWYRRDANPERPDGKLTAWKHRTCYPSRSKIYDESL